MVTPHQASPNKIEPIDDSNITFSTSGIGGNFDFNNTPLATPGTKVVIHKNPGQHKNWDPNGVKGWYLGP